MITYTFLNCSWKNCSLVTPSGKERYLFGFLGLCCVYLLIFVVVDRGEDDNLSVHWGTSHCWKP